MNWQIEFFYCLSFTLLTGSVFWIFWKISILLSIRYPFLITITYHFILLGIIFFCIPFVYLLSSRNMLLDLLKGQTPSFHFTSSAVLDQISQVVFAIWLTGFLFKMLLYLKDRHQLKYILNQCNTKIMPEVLELMQQLCKQLHLKQFPVVYICDETNSPVTISYGKTSILLPKRLYTSKELYQILLHELIHIKHHDLQKLNACQWITAIFWFCPISWAFLYDTKTVCEYACDQAVLSISQKNIPYCFSFSEYFTLILNHIGSQKSPLHNTGLLLQCSKSSYLLKRRMKIASSAQIKVPIYLKNAITIFCSALFILLPYSLVTASVSPITFIHNQVCDNTMIVIYESGSEENSVYTEYTETEDLIYWEQLMETTAFAPTPLSLDFINWSLPIGNRKNSSAYLLSAGDTITLSGSVDPISTNIHIGISDGKTKRYIVPKSYGGFDYPFSISKDDTYIVFAENVGTQSVQIGILVNIQP